MAAGALGGDANRACSLDCRQSCHETLRLTRLTIVMDRYRKDCRAAASSAERIDLQPAVKPHYIEGQPSGA